MQRTKTNAFKESELIYAGNLPKELIQLILDHLKLKDLAAFLSVDKSHYLLSNQFNSLWKQAAIEKQLTKAQKTGIEPDENEKNLLMSIESLTVNEKTKNYRFEIAKLYEELNRQIALKEIERRANEITAHDCSNEMSAPCPTITTMAGAGTVSFFVGGAIIRVISDASHESLGNWNYLLMTGIILTGCILGAMPKISHEYKKHIIKEGLWKEVQSKSPVHLDEVVVEVEPTETTRLIPKSR